MSARRGSLTLTRFFVRGAPPADLRKPFLAAIRLRAFQPLDPDGEASEASGWCVMDRPFDLEFDSDKVFEDRHLVLGFRIDRFRVPPALVRAQMADEEQRLLARSGKNRVSRNERLELRDKIVRRLRRKLAPSTRVVDVVWNLDGGTVWFFSHSKRTLQDFTALFEKTFRLELEQDSPYSAAERCKLPRPLARALERIEPLNLTTGFKSLAAEAKAAANGSAPSKRATRAGAEDPDPDEAEEVEDELFRRIETTRFLGAEFLLWIWVRAEFSTASVRLGEDVDYNVWLDQQLTFESPLDKNERVTVRGMAPADSEEARESIRSRKLPVRARIVLQGGARDFVVGLLGPSFGIAGAKVPAILRDEPSEAFSERMALVEELFALLDELYRSFLLDRLGENWKGAWEPSISAWAEGKSPPPAMLQRVTVERRRSAKRQVT